MTRLLTYITVIFLIIGIPSALAELVQPSRGQWIHWVLIASAVLAALWILRLIIWIKKKRVSTPENALEASLEALLEAFPASPEAPQAGSPSPRGPDWVAPEQGPAYRPEDKLQSEPTPLEPMGYIKPDREGTRIGVWQYLNNQKLNKLVEEKRLTPDEALEYRREIEKVGGDDSSQMQLGGLLGAIEHRAETERQKHDSSPDSILKKYGFNRKKFGL